MAFNLQSVREYRFGPFVLNPVQGSLTEQCENIEADLQLVRFLVVLLSRRGHTVSRRSLERALWPGEEKTDHGSSLNVLAFHARKLLRDDPTNPRYIRTFRLQGYRFIAPVRVIRSHQATEDVRANAIAVAERARHRWSLRTPSTIHESIQLYGQAIKEDSTYPLAYAGRADAWIMAGIHCLMPPKEAFLRARSDAKRAMAKDPRLAEAIVSDAWVKLCFDRDFRAAHREFKRAIALKPDYPFAHNGLALFHIARGEPRRAIQAMTEAWGAEAPAPFLNSLLGDCHYHAREYEEAARRAELALVTNPDFAVAHACLGRIRIQQKRFEEAVRHLEKARDLSPGSMVMAGFLASGYGAAGQQSKAHEILEEFRARRGKSEYVPGFFVAAAEIGLGRKARAIAQLKIAIEERSHWVLFLRTDPLFDPLRRERGFTALIGIR